MSSVYDSWSSASKHPFSILPFCLRLTESISAAFSFPSASPLLRPLLFPLLLLSFPLPLPLPPPLLFHCRSDLVSPSGASPLRTEFTKCVVSVFLNVKLEAASTFYTISVWLFPLIFVNEERLVNLVPGLAFAILAAFTSLCLSIARFSSRLSCFSTFS